MNVIIQAEINGNMTAKIKMAIPYAHHKAVIKYMKETLIKECEQENDGRFGVSPYNVDSITFY